VALLARDLERLEATRRELEQLGGRAIAIATDVADEAQVEAAADHAERELGPIGAKDFTWSGLLIDMDEQPPEA